MPVYKCSKCGRTVEKPEGRYYCSKCGPSAVMVKLTDEERKRKWKTSLTNMELYHLIIPDGALREYTLRTLERFRDRSLEKPLKKFVDEVCEQEGVEPPEIVVVPREVVSVLSDGTTSDATYKPGVEIVAMSPETVYMMNVLHELGHHIDWKRRGMQHLIESEEALKKGLKWEERPTELKARQFAKEGVTKYIALWKQKVEPYIGKGKILPLK
jgi:DNA-directed RNA polymerase subunit RPC12/RpoP